MTQASKSAPHFTERWSQNLFAWARNLLSESLYQRLRGWSGMAGNLGVILLLIACPILLLLRMIFFFVGPFEVFTTIFVLIALMLLVVPLHQMANRLLDQCDRLLDEHPSSLPDSSVPDTLALFSAASVLIGVGGILALPFGGGGLLGLVVAPIVLLHPALLGITIGQASSSSAQALDIVLLLWKTLLKTLRVGYGFALLGNGIGFLFIVPLLLVLEVMFKFTKWRGYAFLDTASGGIYQAIAATFAILIAPLLVYLFSLGLLLLLDLVRSVLAIPRQGKTP